MDYAAERTTC